MSASALQLLWLVPALPLAGFVLNGALALWRPNAKAAVSTIGVGALVLAFAAATAAVAEFARLHQAAPLVFRYWEWMPVGDLRLDFALQFDQLSAVMALVVTGVGALIHLFSVGYMHEDAGYARYFAYLNLFVFFMLMLVLGASFPVMFVGWEGVGLCSYLLIGFWFTEQINADAGKKAFIVNRIGDSGFLIAMFLIFRATGLLDFGPVFGRAQAVFPAAGTTITAVTLLLFLGCAGKSAQIPLYTWLPDAMQGPTPVSALIHAATMVTAGVYLVARCNVLFALSPLGSAAVAGVGALTALFAATIALKQWDIKRVLAYSTISQLGYMFLGVGTGAYAAGIFHLVTHAFFKALLFLGSGSVIQALHHAYHATHSHDDAQDMRNMGGLRRYLPWTATLMWIATLAIAGIPPLAGFFSKDAILGSALEERHAVLFALGMATAALTAFYMARLLFLTFFGRFRGGHEAEHHLHESPWVMLAPLVLLAIGSATVGFVKVPELLAPVFRLPEAAARHPGWLPIAATLVAVLGIAGAYWLYLIFPETPARIRSAVHPAERVLEEKYGFDRAYDGFARRVVVDGSRKALWQGLDATVIDGAVNGAGRFTAGVSSAVRLVQTGLVRGYALLILGGAVTLLGYLLWAR